MQKIYKFHDQFCKKPFNLLKLYLDAKKESYNFLIKIDSKERFFDDNEIFQTRVLDFSEEFLLAVKLENLQKMDIFFDKNLKISDLIQKIVNFINDSESNDEYKIICFYDLKKFDNNFAKFLLEKLENIKRYYIIFSFIFDDFYSLSFDSRRLFDVIHFGSIDFKIIDDSVVNKQFALNKFEILNRLFINLFNLVMQNKVKNHNLILESIGKIEKILNEYNAFNLNEKFVLELIENLNRIIFDFNLLMQEK